jgi:hypothetical protein
MKKIFMIFFTIAVFATSCGKYEEGPSFSMKSKTKRLSREWIVDKVIENEIEITSTYNMMFPNHTMLFLDYGSLKETIGLTEMAKGWKWGEDKETIIVSFSLLGVQRSDTFYIRRLTSKEFWYTVTLDNKNYEFFWKAKK